MQGEADEKANLRRRSDVREPLRQKLQSDTGDDRFVIWRVGVLQGREGGGDGLRQGLMEDLGVGVENQVNTDSSAAKSITARRRRTSTTR